MASTSRAITNRMFKTKIADVISAITGDDPSQVPVEIDDNESLNNDVFNAAMNKLVENIPEGGGGGGGGSTDVVVTFTLDETDPQNPVWVPSMAESAIFAAYHSGKRVYFKIPASVIAPGYEDYFAAYLPLTYAVNNGSGTYNFFAGVLMDEGDGYVDGATIRKENSWQIEMLNGKQLLPAVETAYANDYYIVTGGGEWELRKTPDHAHITISGNITENINVEAFQSLTININDNMTTLLNSIIANNNINVKSNIHMPMELQLPADAEHGFPGGTYHATGYVNIDMELSDVTVPTESELADYFIKINGGTGGSSGFLVSFRSKNSDRWNVERYTDVIPQGVKILFYENSTDALAGNHDVAYIIDPQGM